MRSSVVDVRFPNGMPAMHNVLVLPEQDGNRVVVEVEAHLDAETVRGIALTPTQGLSRGATMIDTGHPLEVPVGRRLLGRMFNVFGETIDGFRAFWEHSGFLGRLTIQDWLGVSAGTAAFIVVLMAIGMFIAAEKTEAYFAKKDAEAKNG